MKILRTTVTILLAIVLTVTCLTACNQGNNSSELTSGNAQTNETGFSDITTTAPVAEPVVNGYSIDDPYNIKEGTDFSNGTAWISFGSTTALIDTQGNIIYQIQSSDGVENVSNIDNDTDCLKIKSSGVYVFIDRKSGQEIKTFTSDDFDYLEFCGGGYAVFSNSESSIDGDKLSLYIVNSKGETIAITEPFTLYKASVRYPKYIGNDMLTFVIYYYEFDEHNIEKRRAKAFVYDIKNKRLIETPNSCTNYCENNFYQVYDGSCYTMSDSGELVKVGPKDYVEEDGNSIWVSSNLLFKRTSDYKLYVYNLETGKEFEFSKYIVQGAKSLSDRNILAFLWDKPYGIDYYTVLDNNGNMMFEPLKGKYYTKELFNIGGLYVNDFESVIGNPNNKKALAFGNSLAVCDLTTGEKNAGFYFNLKVENAYQFHDGLARVEIGSEETVYIDQSGNIVIS